MFDYIKLLAPFYTDIRAFNTLDGYTLFLVHVIL